MGLTNCGSPGFVIGPGVTTGSSWSWVEDDAATPPTGSAAGMAFHGLGRFGARGAREGVGIASEPAPLTGTPSSVWLSGISVGANSNATDLGSGDRGEARSNAASFAVSIGTIEGGLDGLGPDAFGSSGGRPGGVELAGRGIIGVGGNASGFATISGTGIGIAGAFCKGAPATGVSCKTTSGRAGIDTVASVITSPPSDRSSTGSTVGGGEEGEFAAVISAVADCGCVGAVAVARCDAARSPARKARFIGMLRLCRSATGSFQIHELQFLYHHGEAVGSLAG